jgi:hypothetical protein
MEVMAIKLTIYIHKNKYPIIPLNIVGIVPSRV